MARNYRETLNAALQAPAVAGLSCLLLSYFANHFCASLYKISIYLTVAEGPVAGEVASSAALAAGAIVAEDAGVLGVDAEAESRHAQRRRLVLLLAPAARVLAEPPRRRRRVPRR